VYLLYESTFNRNNNMKAVRVHQYGGLEALRYEDVPMPAPGPDEALVRIEAIGVNFIDIYHRIGRYQGSLPLTLGQEAAGTIDAVGSNVKDVKPGDRVVYASVQGAYAEYAIAPAWRLVPVPAGVDAAQAAAVMIQGMTAHYLALSTYPLKEGETALVHAAGGGTGQLLVQIARRCGARVLGTVSTEEKAKLARAAGADEVILYTQVDFETEVKRLTDNKGVDVVYDSVGKDTFDKSLNCLRRRGYMVLYGASSGAVPPLDPQVLNAKG
jgi:NADPH2:quinone reductase